MINEIKLAYAEVDAILNLLEDEYAQRVPQKIREFLKEEKDENYKPIIKADISLLEQNLKRETMILLAILNLNYWCDSEQEKQEILKELKENEQEYQKELYEKYNPENIFKNKELKEINQNVALVEYKEKGFMRKILDKIKKYLRGNYGNNRERF